MKEYFHGLSIDKYEHRQLRERIFEWLGIACLIVLLGLAVMWTTSSYSAPLYQAKAEGIDITLTDQPCKLPAVSNLKFEAIWTEKGKSYKGCYGGHPQLPVVVLYFEDKTVVVLPVDLFVKVIGV